MPDGARRIGGSSKAHATGEAMDLVGVRLTAQPGYLDRRAAGKIQSASLDFNTHKATAGKWQSHAAMFQYKSQPNPSSFNTSKNSLDVRKYLADSYSRN